MALSTQFKEKERMKTFRKQSCYIAVSLRVLLSPSIRLHFILVFE